MPVKMYEEETEIEPVQLVPDQGEDEDDLTGPPSAFVASIGGKDWTVETLVSQMRKGRIDLEPSFQRRNAWLDNRKSKLIESILLGFPVPQIVLAEKPGSPGHFFVLDGKQRLLALRQFFFDQEEPNDASFEPFKLTGLEVFADLNGTDIGTLRTDRPDLLGSLENYSIRTVVLSNWNSDKLLLSLFLRLNTGSVPLSPQELRQALVPGPFMTWLDEDSGKLYPLRTLLGNDSPDRRMVDAELALRHVAFSSSPLPYRGNLKQFLDDTSRTYNADWENRSQAAHDALAGMGQAIEFGIDLFGLTVLCRKWSGTKFERALNRAIFDVQIYSFSFPHVREAADSRGELLLEAFQRACELDELFVRAISATTKTPQAFRVRHGVWASILKSVCDVEYPMPGSLAAPN